MGHRLENQYSSFTFFSHTMVSSLSLDYVAKRSENGRNREILNLFAEQNYAFVLDMRMKMEKNEFLNNFRWRAISRGIFFYRNFQISIEYIFNLPKCTMLICLAHFANNVCWNLWVQLVKGANLISKFIIVMRASVRERERENRISFYDFLNRSLHLLAIAYALVRLTSEC